MTIKLKAPEGQGNISFNGEEYLVDKQGIVDVPSEAAEALIASFGFEVVVEEEKKGSKKAVEK